MRLIPRTAERRIRDGLSVGLATTAGVRAAPAAAVELAAVRRVLFVRPNARMGNLLLLTPAIAAARRALPEAEIDLLAYDAYRPLIDAFPGLDRTIRFERGGLRRPGAIVGLARRIRARGYDLLIDGSCGASFTAAMFARFAGARWTATLAPSRHARLYDVRVDRRDDRSHAIERLATLLEGVGIPVPDLAMRVELDPGELRGARERWAAAGLGEARPLVGVNLGARGEKRWPAASFLEVVRGLVARGDVRVAVFAGPQDLDRLAALEDGLPPEVVVDTTFDVRAFAALLATCDVVVTGDTGPMHLAAGVGTPTVSIFVKGNHPAYAPLGAAHRLVVDPAGTGAAEVLAAVCGSLVASGAPRRVAAE